MSIDETNVDVSVGLTIDFPDRQGVEQEPVVGEVPAVQQAIRGGELHRAVSGHQQLRVHLLPEVQQLRQQPQRLQGQVQQRSDRQRPTKVSGNLNNAWKNIKTMFN